MNPFRRSRELERQLGVDVDEVDAHVPSSAKAPEWQRFAPITLDDLDVSEQDAEFLASLAAGVESGAPVPKRRSQPPAKPATRDRPEPEVSADDLQVFREFTDHHPSESVLANIRVPDVELGDLLDDLQTMRAVLRQRKAA